MTTPSLEEAVRQRVGAALADLMPKDQWDALITKAFSDLTTTRSTRSGSRLEAIVTEELEKVLRQRVGEARVSDEGTTTRKGEVSQHVKRLVAENMEAMMQRWFRSAIQGCLNEAAANLGGRRY